MMACLYLVCILFTSGLVLTAGFAFVFDEAMAQNTLVTAALMPAVLGYALLLVTSPFFSFLIYTYHAPISSKSITHIYPPTLPFT